MPRLRLQSTQKASASSSQWICQTCRTNSRFASSKATKRIVPAERRREAYKPPDPGPKGWGWWNKPTPVLKPLTKPLGQPKPPREGENIGREYRPIWTRLTDYFFDLERKKERHEALYKDLTTSYLQDTFSCRFHQGKQFLATPNLFRSELAMYFPNLQGYTLSGKTNVMSDTTSVLRGKTSIVRVTSQQWAEKQTDTFIGKKKNPELAKAMEELKGQGLQKVAITFEWKWRYMFLLWLFHGRRRRMIPKEDWGRNIVVRMGFKPHIRDSIQVTNRLVGYVYLVDSQCRIRWFGCGNADDEERAQLVSAVKRLAAEGATDSGTRPARRLIQSEDASDRELRPAGVKQAASTSSRTPKVQTLKM